MKMFWLQPTLYQENTGGREEVGVENDKDETAQDQLETMEHDEDAGRKNRYTWSNDGGK